MANLPTWLRRWLHMVHRSECTHMAMPTVFSRNAGTACTVNELLRRIGQGRPWPSLHAGADYVLGQLLEQAYGLCTVSDVALAAKCSQLLSRTLFLCRCHNRMWSWVVHVRGSGLAQRLGLPQLNRVGGLPWHSLGWGAQAVLWMGSNSKMPAFPHDISVKSAQPCLP
jgi:hypothetical protein